MYRRVDLPCKRRMLLDLIDMTKKVRGDAVDIARLSCGLEDSEHGTQRPSNQNLYDGAQISRLW